MSFEGLVEFYKLNKKKIYAIFAIYCVGVCSIGIVNYPYIDDTSRRITGLTGFAASYSRYFSEYASYAVQGSRHLTDLGLMTFLLSALIMTLVSVILITVFHNNDTKEISLASAIGSVFVGLNPWFLSCISFRFDGPYMCLSILASVVPFLFFYKHAGIFFVTSFIGVFLMCNSYQASSGVYLVVFLTMVLLEVLNNNDIKKLIRKITLGALAYIAAMLAYTIEIQFNPELSQRGDATTLAPFKEMPVTVLRNLHDYFKTYKAQCSRLWLCIFALILVIFIIRMIGKSVINKKLAGVAVCVYLLLGSVLSYGAYMFFSTCLAARQLRYGYGFAIFVGILIILLGETWRERNYLNYVQGLTVVLTVYYTLSFVFAYANVLENQKETFESYSAMLGSDLNHYITDNNQNLYVSRMCGNSKAYHNALVNYPVLCYLVPSNELVYWPNVYWFNTLTNLNVNMEAFDFDSAQSSSLDLLEADKLWNIYKNDQDIYVQWK